MAKFGERSNKNLRECHKDLQTLFREVIEHFDCSVIEGHRGEEEQNRLYHADLSELMYPDGNHNKTPSLAADVVPYPVDWKDIKRFYYFGGYVLATANSLYDDGKMDYKVRWGGDWDSDTHNKDQTFHDLPHFELVGVEDDI